jgi:hypothetical protein
MWKLRSNPRIASHLPRRAAVLLLIGAIPGCAEPGHAELFGPDQSQAHRLPGYSTDPVMKVIPFFQPEPACFRSFDPEGDPNPEGFAFTLYLQSARTGLGIHPEGTLQVKMYRLEPTAQGIVTRNLVYESRPVPVHTLPHSTQRTALGWGYAPSFYWGNADVLGYRVEVVVEFTGVDGRVVRSQPRPLKVPPRRS